MCPHWRFVPEGIADPEIVPDCFDWRASGFNAALRTFSTMSRMRVSMIEGERHGRLVLLESLGLDDERQSIGRFLCDCGVVCITAGTGTVEQHPKCGCLWIGPVCLRKHIDFIRQSRRAARLPDSNDRHAPPVRGGSHRVGLATKGAALKADKTEATRRKIQRDLPQPRKMCLHEA
jgi:hypothetical protein